MNILLLGKTGQVGHELFQQLQNEKDLHVYGPHDGFDLSRQKDVNKLYDISPIPDVIINAIAFTDVEGAETERKKCEAVNIKGVKYLTRIAANLKVFLIHYSTDYVFGDHQKEPYLSSDTNFNPLNVYGSSKAIGDDYICKYQRVGRNRLTKKPKRPILGNFREYCYLILRTSWVFSSRRKNFVKTMLDLNSIERSEPIKVIDNQIGSPTSANEIARQTINVLKQIETKDLMSGTLNLACNGYCSWYEFAKEIIYQAKQKGLSIKQNEILPIKDFEYPTKAKRPINSQLNVEPFEKTFGSKIMTWKDALSEVLDEIASESQNDTSIQ